MAEKVINVDWAGWCGWFLVVTYTALPLSFPVIKFALAFSVCVSLCYIFFKFGEIRFNRLSFQFVFVLLVFYFILFFWGWLAAILNGVDLFYAFQDSVGFFLYLLLPVLMVLFQKCEDVLSGFLLLAKVFAIVHIVFFLGFYCFIGVLTYESLIGANAVLKSVGFSAQFGASEAVLRVDFGAGVILLIGYCISLSRVAVGSVKLFSGMVWISIFILSIFVEGHRSFLVAILLFSLCYFLICLKSNNLRARIIAMTWLVCVAFLGASFFLMVTGVVDFESVLVRITSLTDFSSGRLGGDDERHEQLEPLLKMINANPVVGHGFGSQAEVIRSVERPFMYELDLLAVAMKLGFFGLFIYLALFLFPAVLVLKLKVAGVAFERIAFIFSIVLMFIFIMNANGGYAMSPFSTYFHVVIFLLVTKEIEANGRRLRNGKN